MNLFSALQDPAATKMRQAVRLFAEALLELAAEPETVATLEADAPSTPAAAPRPTKAEERLDVVRRLAGSMPALELAKTVGLSQSALYALAKRHSLSLAQPKGRQRKIDLDELRRLAPTMTRQELARHFDCDASSIGQTCSFNKITYLATRRGPAPKVKAASSDEAAAETVSSLPKKRGRPRKVAEVSPAIDDIPSTLAPSGWLEAEAAAAPSPPAPQTPAPMMLEGVSYSITTPDRSSPTPELVEALQPLVVAAVEAMRAVDEGDGSPDAPFTSFAGPPPPSSTGEEPERSAPVAEEAVEERLERLRDEEAGRSMLSFEPLTTPRRQRFAARSVPKIKRRVEPDSKWVRLQHPDGRWLRMDGLDWVEKKADSFQVLRTKLQNVLDAFPLARECKVIPEVAWSPKDILYAETVR